MRFRVCQSFLGHSITRACHVQALLKQTSRCERDKFFALNVLVDGSRVLCSRFDYTTRWDAGEPHAGMRAFLFMHRWSVGVRDEATAASCFVHAGAADGDALFRFKGALRVVRRLAAPHTNRVGLGNVLGDRE